MWLPDQVFKTVIQSTPLISIDLVVRNEKNEVLLGKRLNAPAKDYWFVPGGRIQKDESLDDAFKRLINEELGLNLNIKRHETNFLGVYEHFYGDNVFDDLSTTHYVVLAYEIKSDLLAINNFPMIQHNEYRWWNTEKIVENDSVNIFTKNYMKDLI
ncbi:GDP-mannose mannosyl hydrolase [uncultured Acinetobacter sp.]|uniref:GDP-mannose mannosyl hydrolase n=1 Tax=uncultured Acinetobacter sp. TaxID=165433 RepID=UPI002586C31D|nr:GDP-mannose mannosyl hydrolase [uncultured Acinetobacter sp.]